MDVAAPRSSCRRRPSPRTWFFVAAAAAALLQLYGGSPRAWDDAGTADAVAFTAPSPEARGVSSVARAAAAARRKSSKAPSKAPKRYRGAVNPRLRSFLGAKEYRDIIAVLSNLNEQGELDNFLEKGEEYWKNINVFDMAMQEQKGGQGPLAQIRRDWPKIWPEALDKERMYSFDRFAAFWGRLERSKLIDDVMKDVFPDMDKDIAESNEDREKMKAMSDDERRDIILDRMANSVVLQQYVALCASDAEVQSIASKMAPFTAKFVSILERKIVSQTEQISKTADLALYGGGALVLLVILFCTGVLKLPDPTWTDLGVK